MVDGIGCTGKRDIARDTDGKAPLKFVAGTSLVAMAVAVASPAFETNPLIGDTVMRFREHLPETLDTIRHAMSGHRG
jgi:hypothetical protein